MLRPITTLNLPDLAPIADPSVVTGFQSPADDYKEERLNIMEKLIRDPLNTYFFEVDSDSMQNFDIRKGTLLVVDRTITPRGGNIVVTWVDGSWLVRQLIDLHGVKKLITGQRNEIPIIIDMDAGILIWGVVSWSCSPQMLASGKLRP
ncbi:MAG: S24 family peptidase [Bacteroidota bacterium]